MSEAMNASCAAAACFARLSSPTRLSRPSGWDLACTQNSLSMKIRAIEHVPRRHSNHHVVSERSCAALAAKEGTVQEVWLPMLSLPSDSTSNALTAVLSQLG